MNTNIKITTLMTAVPLLALAPLASADGIIIDNGASISNVSYANETVNAVGTGVAIWQSSSLSDSSFAQASINATASDADELHAISIQIGENKVGSGYGQAVISNIDMSGMTLTAKSDEPYESYYATAIGVASYNATWTNVDFSGTSISVDGNYTENGFWLSSVKASHIDFRNMQIALAGHGDKSDSVVFGLSGNATQWTTLSDADFRGTKVTVNGTQGTVVSNITGTSDFGYEHFYVNNTGRRAEIKNVILGDGEIYSVGVVINDDDATLLGKLADNKGLMLTSAEDTLTIDGGTATLTVSSEATAGQIVLTDAAQLVIADGTTLTLNGAKIVVEVDAGTSELDLSTILVFEGENSALKISGDDVASAFVFRDANGNVVSSVSVDASKVAEHITVIPEPSAFGLLAGAGALALALSRRRRKN